jgi:hypothetical protein
MSKIYMETENLLGKTVLLAPILPLREQNTVPLMLIKPRRGIIWDWALGSGAASAAMTTKTKSANFKAMATILLEKIHLLNLN